MRRTDQKRFSFRGERTRHRANMLTWPWILWVSLLVGITLPGVALGQADSTLLCIQQVYESPLADFEPVGLSTSEDVGPDPAITMWSRTDLLVVRVSPREPAVKSTFRAPLPGVEPIAAALTDWSDGKPIVELLDAPGEGIWTMEFATGETTQVAVAAGAASASGATRTGKGWVRAHRVPIRRADTSSIVLVGPGRGDPTIELMLPKLVNVAQRRIDRILHVRPGYDGGVLLGEAAFPFTTIAFAPDGSETWRASPQPDEMRDLLGESDLRYVVASPAIALDDAVLNTFLAIRSGRRASALRLRNGASVRYRLIANNLAFLGTFPKHRLLVSTRSGQPYQLVIFRWRWIGQRESCAATPNIGRSR